MAQNNGNDIMEYCWNYLGLEVAPKEEHGRGPGQSAKAKVKKKKKKGKASPAPVKMVSNGPTNANPTGTKGTPLTNGCDPVGVPKISNPTPIEYVCHTLIIKSEADLRKMVRLMKGVPEVALNIYGKFGSRGLSEEVGWVCLFLEGTLVCIDVVKLVQENKMRDFWRILSYHIFENEGILKVIFNSLRVEDYLFQRHGIRLANSFDIQTNWDWDWGRRINKEKSLELGPGPPLRLLSDCLKEVLPDKVLPEELNILKESEEEDCTSGGAAFLERPMRDKRVCKLVALQLKYLLRVKEELIKTLVRSPPPKLSNHVDES